MNKEMSANIDMMKIKWLTVLLLIILYTFSLGLSYVLAADPPADPTGQQTSDKDNIGLFKTLTGTPKLTRDGKSIDIKDGESFKLYDIAETEADTNTRIVISERSMILLGGELKSKLVAKEYTQAGEKKGEMKFSLPYGEARLTLCNESIKVETPFADISAYGKLDFEVWDRQVDGEPATCVAVFGDNVKLGNIDQSVKEKVSIPSGMMSCVSAGGVPSDPVDIPKEILEKLRQKDKFAKVDECKKECGECERLNPVGVCVPDNHKLCDDGDVCTSNDRCKGRVCKGQRDPSTTNPNCS